MARVSFTADEKTISYAEKKKRTPRSVIRRSGMVTRVHNPKLAHSLGVVIVRERI